VIGVYEILKVSARIYINMPRMYLEAPPNMDIRTRPFMLRFGLLAIYTQVMVCSECPTTLPSYLVGKNEVALLRGKAQFETRANRFSAPRDFSGTAPFEDTGGPGLAGQETSAVVFNSKSHILNAGSQEMKIGTNGFTAVAVIKFTGNVWYGRIFSFGSTTNEYNTIRISRNADDPALQFVIYNKYDACHQVCWDCIVQGAWQTLILQYNVTTRVLSLRVGEKISSFKCYSVRKDRTFDNMALGNNPYDSVSEMPGKIAHFYAVDNFLSIKEVSEIINNFYLDKDPFDAWCATPHCNPGYSVNMLTTTCERCPIALPGIASAASVHYCNGCTTDHRSFNAAFVCSCDGVLNLQECSCAYGYTGDGSTCTTESQCPAKNTIPFVEHSTIDRNASTGCRCADFSHTHSVYDDVYSIFREKCRCDAGWTGLVQVSSSVITDCSQCPQGKYSVVGGECLPCTQNGCSGCDGHSYWSTSPAICRCHRGFGRIQGYPCTMCLAGTYSDDRQDEIVCSPCGANSYSLDQATSCELPPLNSVVNSDKSGFTCNDAYAISDILTDPCRLLWCPPGKFLENNSCRDCLTGTFKNNYGADSCFPCQTDSTSAIGSQLQSDCLCNAGYSREDDYTCLACVPGKFAADKFAVAQP